MPLFKFWIAVKYNLGITWLNPGPVAYTLPLTYTFPWHHFDFAISLLESPPWSLLSSICWNQLLSLSCQLPYIKIHIIEEKSIKDQHIILHPSLLIGFPFSVSALKSICSGLKLCDLGQVLWHLCARTLISSPTPPLLLNR